MNFLSFLYFLLHLVFFPSRLWLESSLSRNTVRDDSCYRYARLITCQLMADISASQRGSLTFFFLLLLLFLLLVGWNRDHPAVLSKNLALLKKKNGKKKIWNLNDKVEGEAFLNFYPGGQVGSFFCFFFLFPFPVAVGLCLRWREWCAGRKSSWRDWN